MITRNWQLVLLAAGSVSNELELNKKSKNKVDRNKISVYSY